jgi:hypothetical protein
MSKKHIRSQKGFSLPLTIFVGIILTGMTFAIMRRSSSEVQVAVSNSDSVSALNAAESAGAVALDELTRRGNNVNLPTTITAANVLGYLCKDNPMWVLVQRPTAAANYRVISTASSTTAAATFLQQSGTNASSDSAAFDPLTLTSQETLASTHLGVIKAANSNTVNNPVFTGNTTFASNLGMSTLATNSCAGLTNAATGVSPNITAKNYLPGTDSLNWTASSIDPVSGDIMINQRQLGNLGDKRVWSIATLQNFKLSQVQVLAGTQTGDPTRNKPLSLFRLVYSFTLKGEGQIRTANGTVVGRQVIQAPNILIIDLAETTNANFAQYGYFVDNFGGLYFGGNEVYDGVVHTNTAPGFYYNTGENAPKILGTFTTAGCRTKPSSATVCQTPNISAGKYGTYYTAGSALGSTASLALAANFQGGSKFSEDGIGYIDKPSSGDYQLKAALFGQASASPNPNDDVMKNSEIRAQLGVKVSSETATPNGVYWTNPTNHSDSATASSRPSDYSSWLTKATDTNNSNNNTSNLLSGLYIKGDVDYINMYAAKSSSSASSPDVQVVEVQQTTTESGSPVTRKTKFTMNKSANTMEVRVASGTGSYGAAISYNNAPNGVIFVDGKVGADVGSDPAYKRGCTTAAKSSCRGVISIPETTDAATLSFPGSVNDTPTIQKDWGLTIAANGDVAIQDNLNYQVDPRGADRQFDNPNGTGTQDDPSIANAQNTLGIVAFDNKKVKDASGTVSSSSVNGAVYWGNGLKDNARRDSVNGSNADVVDIQASIYGNTAGIGSSSTRLAEYIRLLGGEIQSNAGPDFSDGCPSTANIPSAGGTLISNICKGGRMNLTGDRRMQNGNIAPPGFPTLANGTLVYLTSPVGQQSVGVTRWQTLMYQPS